MDQLPRQATLAVVGWNSPRATDGTNGGLNQANGALSSDASKAGWTAPRSTDAKHGHHYTPGMDGKDLAKDASLASGTTPSGTDAPTASSGGYLLNPYFSAWLMGLPKEWVTIGLRAASRLRKGKRGAIQSSKELATQSMLNSQPSSSDA